MKLKLSDLLLELGSMYTPGLRPEGPSNANKHKFPHHGLYTKQGGKPFGDENSPYPSPTGDLKNGDRAAEIGTDQEDLPEASLEEFFKFTTHAGPTIRRYEPVSQGGGAPSMYGRDDYATYDPGLDDDPAADEDPRRDEKEESIAGRASQKVGTYESYNALLELGVGTRDKMHPRADGPGDTSTKQPWSQGIPGSDKKDIVNGEAKIDDLYRDFDKDKERERFNNGISDELERELDFDEEDHPLALINDPSQKTKKKGKRLSTKIYDPSSSTKIYDENLEMSLIEFVSRPGKAVTMSADDAFAKKFAQTARTEKSDLAFWDVVGKGNRYLMGDPDEVTKKLKKAIDPDPDEVDDEQTKT